MFCLIFPSGMYEGHTILQVAGPVDGAGSKVLPPVISCSVTCFCVSLWCVILNVDLFGFQVCVPVQSVPPAKGSGSVWLHQQEGEPQPDQADHPHPQQGQPFAQHRPGETFLPYLLQSLPGTTFVLQTKIKHHLVHIYFVGNHIMIYNFFVKQMVCMICPV